MKLNCEIVEVTPAQAEAWLGSNVHNRKMKNARVAMYAESMKRGDWFVINQGIGFDRDGNLLDGQNRLAAVVMFGKPVKMLVVSGLEKESQLIIDTGSGRTTADLVRLSKGYDVTNSHVAVAKRMYYGVKDRKKYGHKEGSGKVVTLDPIQDVQVFDRFYSKYHKAIEFGIACFVGKKLRGITTAPVIAPIARAYYSVEQERLRQFGQMLLDGFTQAETDRAALALRNWLLSTAASAAQSWKMTPRAVDTYRRTEVSLKAFCENEPMERIRKGTLVELFPLPGEPKSVVG